MKINHTHYDNSDILFITLLYPSIQTQSSWNVSYFSIVQLFFKLRLFVVQYRCALKIHRCTIMSSLLGYFNQSSLTLKSLTNPTWSRLILYDLLKLGRLKKRWFDKDDQSTPLIMQKLKLASLWWAFIIKLFENKNREITPFSRTQTNVNYSSCEFPLGFFHSYISRARKEQMPKRLRCKMIAVRSPFLVFLLHSSFQFFLGWTQQVSCFVTLI